jgi:hypothetical protein
MHDARTFVFAAAAFAALVSSGNAYGVQQRTFVASFGIDVDGCKVAAPCATFAAAAAQTQEGGEIVVLDSGQFGPLTITTSIAIIGPGGVHAGIAVASGTGIVIAAPGKRVRLEGLSVQGTGGAIGVRIDAADLVIVERCSVIGFSDAGIKSAASGARIFVHDSRVSDNLTGIKLEGPTTIIVEASRIESNVGQGVALTTGPATIANSTVVRNGGHGVSIQGASTAIAGTLIAENGADGIHATAAASTALTLSLSASQVRRNNNGVVLVASSGASIGADIEDSALSDHPSAALSAANTGGTIKITLTGNAITQNTTGVANTGALIESRGNNTFNYNGANGGPFTSIPGV